MLAVKEQSCTGGMVTKLNAADIATNSGIHVVLANGDDPFTVFHILSGEKQEPCLSVKTKNINFSILHQIFDSLLMDELFGGF